MQVKINKKISTKWKKGDEKTWQDVNSLVNKMEKESETNPTYNGLEQSILKAMEETFGSIKINTNGSGKKRIKKYQRTKDHKKSEKKGVLQSHKIKR